MEVATKQGTSYMAILFWVKQHVIDTRPSLFQLTVDGLLSPALFLSMRWQEIAHPFLALSYLTTAFNEVTMACPTSQDREANRCTTLFSTQWMTLWRVFRVHHVRAGEKLTLVEFKI